MSFIMKYNSRFSHLLVAVGDVADLVPRKGALGCQLVVRLVDVQTQGVHSQKKICSLFILNHINRVKQGLSSTRLLRDAGELYSILFPPFLSLFPPLFFFFLLHQSPSLYPCLQTSSSSPAFVHPSRLQNERMGMLTGIQVAIHFCYSL